MVRASLSALAKTALEEVGIAGLLAGVASLVGPLLERVERLEAEVERGRQALEKQSAAELEAGSGPEPSEPVRAPEPAAPLNGDPTLGPASRPCLTRLRRVFGR